MIILNPQKKETPTVEKLALNTREVAEMLGVCERTVWSLGKTGKIPTVKAGKRILYPVEGLRKFVNGE